MQSKFRVELSKEEKLQKQRRRERLLTKFPDGIAEIEAIWDKKEPFVEKPKLVDYQKPRATCTPPIPIHIFTGATHPVSGLPVTEVRTPTLSIWPISGRTDQAGLLTKYYTERLPSGKKGPIGLLEILADPDMGWGTIYNLKAVQPEVLEAERRQTLSPESRKELERLEHAGNLKSNDGGAFKLKQGERLVVERTDDGEAEEVDSLEQFTEEELAQLDEGQEGNAEPVTMEQD